MAASVHHVVSKEVEIISLDTIEFLDTCLRMKTHSDKVVGLQYFCADII